MKNEIRVRSETIFGWHQPAADREAIPMDFKRGSVFQPRRLESLLYAFGGKGGCWGIKGVANPIEKKVHRHLINRLQKGQLTAPSKVQPASGWKKRDR